METTTTTTLIDQAATLVNSLVQATLTAAGSRSDAVVEHYRAATRRAETRLHRRMQAWLFEPA